jgi:chromosome partitioning protein
MNGVNHIEAMINVIREKTDHVLDYQILITLYEPDNTACKVILNKFHDQHAGKVLQTIIEKDNKIQESQIAHTPVIFYSRDSRAGLQYHKLAEEIINKQNVGQEKTYASALG